MRKLIKKRLKAFLIDTIILEVGVVILIILMININKSFLYIYSLTAIIIYSLFFCKDLINGQSIGKRVLKLQITTENGEAESLRNIIVRNMIALLQPIDILYMINNKGKRLGDIICKTKVVNVSQKIKYDSKPLFLIAHFVIVFIITFSFFFVIWITFIGKFE